MNKKSSVGIITVGIIEIAVGVYGAFLALDIVTSFSKISKDLTPHMAEKFNGAIPISITTLILASSVIFLGIFLIKRSRVSRLMHVMLSPLIAIFIVNTLWGFVIQLISYLNIAGLLNLSELLIGAVLIIIITFGYLYYFTRPRVKEQFKNHNKTLLLTSPN